MTQHLFLHLWMYFFYVGNRDVVIWLSGNHHHQNPLTGCGPRLCPNYQSILGKVWVQPQVLDCDDNRAEKTLYLLIQLLWLSVTCRVQPANRPDNMRSVVTCSACKWLPCRLLMACDATYLLLVHCKWWALSGSWSQFLLNLKPALK